MNVKKLIGIVFILLFSLVSVNAVTLNDSLVYYSFDENKTSLITNNDVIGTQGLINGAYDFDGINDYLEDSSTVYGVSTSVSFWINVNTWTAGDFPFTSVAGNNGVFCQLQTSPQITCKVSDSSGTTYGGTVTLANATGWHHIVVTGTSGDVDIWADGVKNDVSSSTFTRTAVAINTIFGRHKTVSTNYYDGLLDEFTIYQRVLNSSEISTLYNSGSGQESKEVLNDYITYFPFDSLYDFSNNSHYLTSKSNINQFSSGCILNTCFNYDGSTDYILGDSNLITSGDITVSAWIKTTQTTAGTIFSTADSTGQDGFSIGINRLDGGSASSGRFWGAVDIGTNGFESVAISDVNNGSWHYVVMTFDNTNDNLSLYMDNVLLLNRTVTNPDLNGANFAIGTWAYDYNNVFFNGQIDELSVWNRVLSDSELTTLYNSGTGYNPYAESISPTPTITSNLTTYYNTTNITVKLNTTSNTNMSYVLDNLSETSICNNCSEYNLTLTSLSEALHNITWISTDENGQVNTTENFTIDITLPVINNNISAEYNEYSINGFNSSCNDTNLDYCNISLNSQNVLLNVSTFTFTLNGNITYNITAADLAGNVVTENGTIYVDPNQRFRLFNVLTNTSENNFTLTLNDATNYTTTDGQIEIKISEFNFNANNTLTVNTIGFQSTEFTYYINSTSNWNETLNGSSALVILNFFDIDTLATINNVSFTISGTPFANNYTTTTGTANITDFSALPAVYELISNSEGYAQNSRFFTFTGKAIQNISVYLIKLNDTTSVSFIVRDQGLETLGGITLTIKRYDITTNSYIAVDEKETNSLGEATFDLDINSKYQYVMTDGTDTITTVGQYITSTPIFLEFAPQVTPVTVSTGINLYSVMSFVNTTENKSNGYFRWDYNDPTNQVTRGCLYTYKVVGGLEVLQNISCADSDSATVYSNTFAVDSGKTYITKGFIVVDGETELGDQDTFRLIVGVTEAWGEGLGLLFTLTLFFVLVLGAVKQEAHPILIMILSFIPMVFGALLGSSIVKISSVITFGSILLYALMVRRK